MTLPCGHTHAQHDSTHHADRDAARECVSEWIRQCRPLSPRVWRAALVELADLYVANPVNGSLDQAWGDRAADWHPSIIASIVAITGVAFQESGGTVEELVNFAAQTATPAVVGVVLMSQAGQHGNDDMAVPVAYAVRTLTGRDRLVVALIGLGSLQVLGFTAPDLLALADPIPPQQR